MLRLFLFLATIFRNSDRLRAYMDYDEKEVHTADVSHKED